MIRILNAGELIKLLHLLRRASHALDLLRNSGSLHRFRILSLRSLVGCLRLVRGSGVLRNSEMPLIGSRVRRDMLLHVVLGHRGESVLPAVTERRFVHRRRLSLRELTSSRVNQTRHPVLDLSNPVLLSKARYQNLSDDLG